MESFDLNIKNYNLEDILKLFNVNYNFDKKDLKRAYKKVIRSHPDKSNLDPKYFHFFVEAYKLLSGIYQYHEKKNQSTEYEDYNEHMAEDHKLILNSLKKENFNEWFNDMFKKVKIVDKEHDSGYEDWLKSNNDIFDTTNIAKHDMDRVLHERKKYCRDLVVKRGLEELGGGNSEYELSRNKPMLYSSKVFSKLTYEDLKKAHIESVIPVTKEDYENVPKFKNVDSYKRYRKKQDLQVTSLDQAKKMKQKREEMENKTNIERAYYIYKQDEEIEKMNKKWWGHLKQLK